MREEIVTLDATGVARDVGSLGYGFRLVPARPQGSTNRPGSYPIKVQPDGGSKSFDLTSDDSKVFEDPFRSINITGGEAGDTWKVQIFESRRELVLPPGQRGSVAVPVQAAAAVPMAAPALSTDGIKVRPGTRSHTFYAAGVACLARLWVRSARGTWVDTGEDLDFTTNAAQVRLVYASADRVYLQASALGMTLEIDSEVEVG